MPDPVTGLIVGGSQLIGGAMQARAARGAAGAQERAAERGQEELTRQFEATREILAPYVQAGVGGLEQLQPFAQAGAPALEQQQALLGLRGPEAQRAAIEAIQAGPGFQEQIAAGEEALLQRASATGGLRGGNIQAALAQFRPQMLRQAIEQQYGRLGGLTALGQTTAQNIAQLGQAAAAGTGSAALRTGADVAGLMQQAGAAEAGGKIGQAAAFAPLFNLPGQILGAQYGAAGKLGQPGFSNLFSDRRLKRDIRRIGTRSDGLGVYEFEYVWGGGRRTGLMAQEVREVYPHAVGERAGFLTVDYAAVPGV